MMENVTREMGQVVVNRDEVNQRINRYQFNLTAIKHHYKRQHSTWKRELGKWAFAIGTFGLGALYLWATTQIVKEGEIGLRRDSQGNLILLPPGRHSNFPWESYASEPKSLAQSLIELGPYKIITVHTGFVAKTYCNGNLEILPAGQYLISNASHTIDKEDVFVSVKEETKSLDEIIALTSDNIELKIKADVRYQIDDPELLISRVRAIEKTIFEIAKLNIAQVVNHHSLAEFVPTTVNADIPMDDETFPEREEDVLIRSSSHMQDDNQDIQLPAKGLSNILQELTRGIRKQFEAKGIKLLNIGITTWDYVNQDLASKLGEGAVIQSQIRSKIMAAKQAAKVKAIEADAEAQALKRIAEGKADSIAAIGNAHVDLAEAMKANPSAALLYQWQKQVEMLQYSTHPNLFFNMGMGGNNGDRPLMTIPVTNTETVFNV